MLCEGRGELNVRARHGLGTFGGMSRARSGMWRSPITRMRKAIVPLGIIMQLERN